MKSRGVSNLDQESFKTGMKYGVPANTVETAARKESARSSALESKAFQI
jgi:hypothetical protein